MSLSTQRVTTFISSAYLANPDTARLGRIVLDPRNPDAPSCDLFPNQEELIHSSQFEISVSASINLVGTYNSGKKKSLYEALHQLFSGPISTQGMTLEGETQRYQLENPDIAFKKACGEKRVREWLQENVIKAQLKAYMVVGYHTIKSARIVKDNKLCGTSAAAAPGLAALVNLSSSSIASSNDSQQGFTIGLERIWGVQYRKVVCKLTHWSSDIQLKLKDNEWKMPWDVRGQDNSNPPVAEADLGDAAEPESEDSDDEEEAPESYFDIRDDSEEVVEEFILFHDQEDEE